MLMSRIISKFQLNPSKVGQNDSLNDTVQCIHDLFRGQNESPLFKKLSLLSSDRYNIRYEYSIRY